MSFSLVRNDNSNDDTVKSKGAAKDLNDEHLQECAFLLSIDEGCRWTDNSNADAACKVRETNHRTCSEDLISLSLGFMEGLKILSALVPFPLLWFALEEDGNNNTINCNSFTENNGDQVLTCNSRRLDWWTKDRRAWDQNATKWE